MIKQKTAVLVVMLLCFLGVATTVYIIRLRDAVAIYKVKAEIYETACNSLIERYMLEDNSNYGFVKK